MATYKGIQGHSVQTLASDPSPTASVEGQLWYNSTSGTYKIAIAGAGAWAAGENLIAANWDMAGAGIQTAALMMGGQNPGAQGITTVDAYNGLAWSNVNGLTTGRYRCRGVGIQTAALTIGGNTGSISALVESYNGTSWTEAAADLNTARSDMGTAGTSTAGLAFGGQEPGSTAVCETWNGSTWTEIGNLNKATVGQAGFGTNTAALSAGGSPYTPSTMKWNGTSWTAVNNINTPRRFCSGSGTSTAGIIWGGWTSPDADSALTESYDGTSWTEVADLATSSAFGAAGVSSPNTLSIAFGGIQPTPSNATEEWNGAPIGVKTVTTS